MVSGEFSVKDVYVEDWKHPDGDLHGVEKSSRAFS